MSACANGVGHERDVVVEIVLPGAAPDGPAAVEQPKPQAVRLATIRVHAQARADATTGEFGEQVFAQEPNLDGEPGPPPHAQRLGFRLEGGRGHRHRAGVLECAGICMGAAAPGRVSGHENPNQQVSGHVGSDGRFCSQGSSQGRRADDPERAKQAAVDDPGAVREDDPRASGVKRAAAEGAGLYRRQAVRDQLTVIAGVCVDRSPRGLDLQDHDGVAIHQERQVPRLAGQLLPYLHHEPGGIVERPGENLERSLVPAQSQKVSPHSSPERGASVSGEPDERLELMLGRLEPGHVDRLRDQVRLLEEWVGQAAGRDVHAVVPFGAGVRVRGC
ncbi:MAG: hypothetical protein H7233_01250 [Pseudorhodobacter sp.]|nr:hypothetical protein [Frankiaceae bacterium]